MMKDCSSARARSARSSGRKAVPRRPPLRLMLAPSRTSKQKGHACATLSPGNANDSRNFFRQIGRRSSMSKTTQTLAALALSALAMTATFAQGGGGGGQRGGGGGAPGGGGQGGGARGPQQPMSFFITSVGKGDGANYGGLAGADAYCQQMATAAG